MKKQFPFYALIFFSLAILNSCFVGTPLKGGQPCQNDTDCPSPLICFQAICVPHYPQESPPHEKINPPHEMTDMEKIFTQKENFPIDSGTTSEKKTVAEENITPEDSPSDTLPQDKTPRCIDRDKDGYCQNILGSRKAKDCDDNDPSVHPSAKELCDGKDNDCDGRTDEDFPQKGQKCTAGLGICKREGIYICSPNHQSLLCNAVPGTPQKETCDGKDNNCNGNIDEGCQCTTGTKRLCYTGHKGCTQLSNGQYHCQGSCKTGTQICDTHGRWGKCQGETKPTQETCNNQDDDCDGQIDEGLTVPCYNGPKWARNVGICKEGFTQCKNGRWAPCQGYILPKTEICQNGKDDDCDGKTDTQDPDCQCQTGQTRSCYTGKSGCIRSGNKFICKGICKAGTQTCNNGLWGPCLGQILSQKEKCNNFLDDDCDGNVDEGCSTACIRRCNTDADCQIDPNCGKDYECKPDPSPLQKTCQLKSP